MRGPKPPEVDLTSDGRRDLNALIRRHDVDHIVDSSGYRRGTMTIGDRD